MFDGFFGLSCVHQGHGEVELRLGKVGRHLHGLGVALDGLLLEPAFIQGAAQAFIGHIIAGDDFNRTHRQRDAVLPVAEHD